MPCVEANQNLIRHDDQQKELSARQASSRAQKSQRLCLLPCRNSGLAIEASIETRTFQIDTLPDDIVPRTQPDSHRMLRLPPSLARQYERSTRSRSGTTHPIQSQLNHEERDPGCLAHHVVPASRPVSHPPPTTHPPHALFIPARVRASKRAPPAVGCRLLVTNR